MTCCVFPSRRKRDLLPDTDFLDLNFTNVGKINGRQIDAKVHFNSMTVGKRNASGERGDNYFAVCYLADESMWMSSTIAGIGAGYRAPKTIDITTTMYWHDTGKVVNLPFFQCLSRYRCRCELLQGSVGRDKADFRGSFINTVHVSSALAAIELRRRKLTDVGGNDSLWKAGFYAPTTGGTFRGVFTEGNCATQFMPYSAYTMMSNPVKSSDSRDRNVEGDEIDYTITQKIGKFYVDTMTPYSSLVMTDRLPEGLSYQSAAIYDGSGRDITSRGSLSYDESSRTVSFTMERPGLPASTTIGETLCLKIETRVDPVESPLKTVKNSATTTIDKDVKLTSNEICDTLAIPYHVKYEYVCGTKGRKLPKEISTQSGAYQVSDESAYYQGDMVRRKDTPEDGTVYKELSDGDGEEKGSWVLQWDAETQKIDQSDVTFTGTWRYVPAPRLVIEKSISLQSDQLTEEPRISCFLFRITGASSGKVWYRSVSFRSDSVAKAKTAADGSGKDLSGSGRQYVPDRRRCAPGILSGHSSAGGRLSGGRAGSAALSSGAVRKRLCRRFRVAAG